jgi:hypothetical protein
MILLALLSMLPCPLYAQTTRTEVLRQLRELVEQQKDQLIQAQQKAQLAAAGLTEAQVQVDKIATERDGWRAYGEDQYSQRMNAEVRVQKAQKQVWRLRFVLGAILVLIAAYIFLKLKGWMPI